MSDTNTILQALGRIEGKVDEIKEAAREHRDDDKRRFTEVHKKLDDHERDINQAKGAKAAILLFAGGLASLISLGAAALGKLFGGH